MSGQRQSLETSLLATLAYFDIFDYPLRVEELWRWLYVVDPSTTEELRAVTPLEVERTVRRLEASSRLERVGDFVVLPGRSRIIATRMERKVVSERMWRRARRASSALRLVPFVRFVGVVNTLALDNAKPESDIDFFIIVRRGRMWLTRLIVTVLVHMLGIRRYGRKVANRVCLSFFLSDRSLSLDGMKFDADDPYLAFWTASIVPMFDREGTWASFLSANRWMLSRLPNGQSIVPTAHHADAWLPGMIRSAGELLLGTWFGQAVEYAAQRVQSFKMRFPSITDEDRGESGVVVTNDILKFHERDRRRQYRQAFRTRLDEVM